MDLLQARLHYLFQRYKNGVCTTSERKELMELIRNQETEALLKGLILEEVEAADKHVFAVTKELSEGKAAEILSGILKLPDQDEAISQIGRQRAIRWMSAAAAVLLLVTGYRFLLKSPEKNSGILRQSVDKTDIRPGINGAVLTLGNGQQITLDSTKNTRIVRQGGSYMVVEKGQLSIYSKANHHAVEYNTLTTPRGSLYKKLTLADGSKVVLDAGSSIRFPTSFNGPERRVEVTGQVWFDIIHGKKPFKVIAKGTEIRDLGTQFNVNAYDDEAGLKVTLLQGEVKIRSSVLKPGQQAQVSPSSIKLAYPDLNEVMAWKNNYFFFRDADIKTIMHELSRWYDIDVTYEGKISGERFSGKIGRNLTLRDLLDGLAQARVHYRIKEGRKLVLLP